MQFSSMAFQGSVCPRCNGTRHLKGEQGLILCPVCGTDLLWTVSRLPSEARAVTFDVLKPYPWLLPAMESAWEVVNRPAPSWWFTMEGNFGIGKTALIYAMCNYLIGRGIPVLYMRAFEAMQHIKDGFSDNTASDRTTALQTVKVLALDELAYSMSEYDSKVISDIMGYRYARGNELLTLMAYNPPHTLPPLVASRIMDGRSRFFKLAGTDLRPHVRG